MGAHGLAALGIVGIEQNTHGMTMCKVLIITRLCLCPLLRPSQASDTIAVCFMHCFAIARRIPSHGEQFIDVARRARRNDGRAKRQISFSLSLARYRRCHWLIWNGAHDVIALHLILIQSTFKWARSGMTEIIVDICN